MQVVLTGRCNTGSGFTERSEICRVAGNVGVTVQATVKLSIDYLVASRTDTVKARRAAEMGVEVIDYFEFFRIIRARGSSPDYNPDNQVQGRIRPITGSNAGRMAGRETLTGHLEDKAEARKMEAAGLKVPEPEDKPTPPRPHRLLDL